MVNRCPLPHQRVDLSIIPAFVTMKIWFFLSYAESLLVHWSLIVLRQTFEASIGWTDRTSIIYKQLVVYLLFYVDIFNLSGSLPMITRYRHRLHYVE
jgi:hypothetical protein